MVPEPSNDPGQEIDDKEGNLKEEKEEKERRRE